jgi:hypothetical protein
MASDDRFELVVEGTYLGKNVRNVYYYLQTNGEEMAADVLAGEFAETPLQAIRTVTVEAMVWERLFAKNLDNPEDFYDYILSPSQGGNIVAEGMPPFVTFSFIYHRTTLAVRNGWKRYAGVPESYVVDGVLASGTPATNIAALAEALDEPVTNGSGTTFLPVIMNKIRIPPEGEFESFLYTEYSVADVDFAHIGSQNTRKF